MARDALQKVLALGSEWMKDCTPTSSALPVNDTHSSEINGWKHSLRSADFSHDAAILEAPAVMINPSPSGEQCGQL